MQLSQFAHQLSSDSGIISLMEDLGAALNSEENICMLGGGNPGHIPEVQAYFREQMLSIASDPQLFNKMVGDYDGPQGNQYFISLLADFFSELYGWPICTHNIAITNGSQASFSLLFNILGGEHDQASFKQILLPLTPEYIGYADVGLSEEQLFTARRPLIKIIDETFYKYHVNFDQLHLDDNIGAVCISRPTNPTGNVITDQELKRLSQLSKDKDIPLIIDSAYGLPFPDMVFTQATPLWAPHHILCLSLSKLGLPGVRTGIIIAPETIIERIRNANAIFNLAPGSVGPALVAQAIKTRHILTLSQKIIKPFYKKRRDAALSMIKREMLDLPVRIHQPEGSMFLWLWLEDLPINVQTLYERLKARNVLIIAGQHFFPGLQSPYKHQHECIRMSYAGDPQSVELGIQIIAQEVKQAYDGM